MSDGKLKFEDELYALAIVDKDLKEKEEILEQEIYNIEQSIEAELAPYRAQLEAVRADRQLKLDNLAQQANAYLDTAATPEEEKEMRKNLHHLIKVRSKTVYIYDADEARDEVIKTKNWELINKPTLSKSKLQAAMKKGTVDWIDYKIQTEQTVDVGKLGEIIIMLENIAARAELAVKAKAKM